MDAHRRTMDARGHLWGLIHVHWKPMRAYGWQWNTIGDSWSTMGETHGCPPTNDRRPQRPMGAWRHLLETHDSPWTPMGDSLRPLADPCEFHGRPTGDPSEIDGSPVETHERSTGHPWEKANGHGGPTETHGSPCETVGDSLKTNGCPHGRPVDSWPCTGTHR